MSIGIGLIVFMLVAVLAEAVRRRRKPNDALARCEHGILKFHSLKCEQCREQVQRELEESAVGLPAIPDGTAVFRGPDGQPTTADKWANGFKLKAEEDPKGVYPRSAIIQDYIDAIRKLHRPHKIEVEFETEKEVRFDAPDGSHIRANSAEDHGDPVHLVAGEEVFPDVDYGVIDAKMKLNTSDARPTEGQWGPVRNVEFTATLEFNRRGIARDSFYAFCEWQLRRLGGHWVLDREESYQGYPGGGVGISRMYRELL